MAKVKKLKKPVKKTGPAYYDFYEVMHFLEQETGKDFRDYAGKFDGEKYNKEIEYQDFWHWICDQNDIRNGCWIHLPEWNYYMNNKSTESWKKEIMQHFYDFLGEDYHERMWCEW